MFVKRRCIRRLSSLANQTVFITCRATFRLEVPRTTADKTEWLIFRDMPAKSP
jgi:hypothetical protein